MKALVFILIGGILLVIFEICTAIASFVHIGILDEEFGHGIRKGMVEYVLRSLKI